VAKELLKRLLRLTAGPYSIYRIFESPQPDGAPSPGASPADLATPPEECLSISESDGDDLANSESELFRSQAWYGGNEALVFVCRAGPRIVGACIYWYGLRYQTRNFWPLKAGEVKLVQVVVDPEYRGRGIAASLICTSWAALRRKGFTRGYARIWRSNDPSLRAFRKARWREIATVVEMFPLNLGRKVRVVRRRKL